MVTTLSFGPIVVAFEDLYVTEFGMLRDPPFIFCPIWNHLNTWWDLGSVLMFRKKRNVIVLRTCHASRGLGTTVYGTRLTAWVAVSTSRTISLSRAPRSNGLQEWACYLKPAGGLDLIMIWSRTTNISRDSSRGREHSLAIWLSYESWGWYWLSVPPISLCWIVYIDFLGSLTYYWNPSQEDTLIMDRSKIYSGPSRLLEYVERVEESEDDPISAEGAGDSDAIVNAEEPAEENVRLRRTAGSISTAPAPRNRHTRPTKSEESENSLVWPPVKLEQDRRHRRIAKSRHWSPTPSLFPWGVGGLMKKGQLEFRRT